jgi:hypothetical protein
MKKKMLLVLVLLMAYPTLSVSAQEEPFSIQVSPQSAEIEKTDPVTYIVTVNAEPDFEDSIDIVLEVSVASISRSFTIGTVYPPYPQTFEHILTIPEEIPVGVTISGIIVASGGGYVVEEPVSIKIKGSILDPIINMINQIINQIREIINNLF